MNNEKEIEQLRAELAQAQTECNVLAMTFTDANELHAIVRGELAQAQAEHVAAEYGLEMEELRRQLAQRTNSRDYWVEKCRVAEIERDQARQAAQEQSETVQRDWLSPCQKVGLEALVETLKRQLAGMKADLDDSEADFAMTAQALAQVRAELVDACTAEAAIVEAAKALLEQLLPMVSFNKDAWMACGKEFRQLRETLKHRSDAAAKLLERLARLDDAEAEGLRRQLTGAEAQIAATKEAVEWIWGYWDGNTLIARSSGYKEEIGMAWNKLLAASGAFSKSWEHHGGATTKLLERLAMLDAAEAALAGCGIGGIRDEFSSPADAIEQMSAHIEELSRQLDTVRRWREKAEHRANVAEAARAMRDWGRW